MQLAVTFTYKSNYNSNLNDILPFKIKDSNAYGHYGL